MWGSPWDLGTEAEARSRSRVNVVLFESMNAKLPTKSEALTSV